MPTHLQLKNRDGSTFFADLPAGMSLVDYRDQLWPQGIAMEYSWDDNDPRTPPPAGYLAAAAQAAEENALPLAAIGIAAVVAFLLLRRK